MSLESLDGLRLSHFGAHLLNISDYYKVIVSGLMQLYSRSVIVEMKKDEFSQQIFICHVVIGRGLTPLFLILLPIS
jgi:hypothetical protein